MRVLTHCSKGLNTCSVILKGFGTIAIIISVIFILTKSADVGLGLLVGGISMVILGVLFKGLYPISLIAEKYLADAGHTDFYEDE